MSIIDRKFISINNYDTISSWQDSGSLFAIDDPLIVNPMVSTSKSSISVADAGLCCFRCNLGGFACQKTIQITSDAIKRRLANYHNEIKNI